MRRIGAFLALVILATTVRTAIHIHNWEDIIAPGFGPPPVFMVDGHQRFRAGQRVWLMYGPAHVTGKGAPELTVECEGEECRGIMTYNVHVRLDD